MTKRNVLKGYLFDSNIIVALLKNESAIKEFVRLSSADKMAIYFSNISVTEIYAGIKEAELSIVQRLFVPKRCLSVTLEISKEAGLLRGKLREKNRKLKTPDAIIAATAGVYGLLIVTRDSDFNNLSDFGVKSIKI